MGLELVLGLGLVWALVRVQMLDPEWDQVWGR